MADRVTPKRIFLIGLLALFSAAVFVPGAAAGNFDEEKMGCTGDNPATCPTGTVGQPYSLTIYLAPPDGGRGEDFGCATFHVTSGNFPPGLSVSDEGFVSGTPTEAGKFEFYFTVRYDKEPGCQKPASDDRFIIPINPGTPPPPPVPKLTIGPETTPPGTVGTAYSLAMTANLADAKTWSIVSGGLPPGLAIDASTGIISGTPTASGSFFFTVHAAITPERTDTKTLGIHVRDPLTIAVTGAPQNGNGNGTRSRIIRSEVGQELDLTLAAAGGLAPYTWAQTGSLPDGIEFDPETGELAGVLEAPGTYRFVVALSDAEGRRTTYAGRLVVAPRLAITTRRMPRGRVGLLYRARLRSTGGVSPVSWRVKRGPLPRGVRFDRRTGSFLGTPTTAGTWVVTVEAVDTLRVKVTTNVVFVVAPAARTR